MGVSTIKPEIDVLHYNRRTLAKYAQQLSR